MLSPAVPVEVRPLSTPRIHLIRMAVFLILCGFVALILFRQLREAFFGNPGLNGLIIGLVAVGIILSIRQVARLFREIRWVNFVSGATPNRLARPPVLLAPAAAMIADPAGRTGLSVGTVRALLDSVGSRLDEGRELVRYLAGLLVFLGLLGTFWGLIETVNSVGRIIGSLRTGAEAAVLFDELKSALAAPLGGMGIAFSASLFGLAGSLVLGFLDLQAGQAQTRFYTELEDWLAASIPAVPPPPPATIGKDGPAMPAGVPPDLAQALGKLADTVAEGASGRAASDALVVLADGVQNLVQHMRTEQQMIRDWVEAQAVREKDMKAVLERLSGEKVG